MANNKIDIGINQTKGTFQLSGIVNGVEKNGFYSEGTSSNGKAYRKVNFGVEIEKGKTVYVSLFGSVQDNVYFSKKIKDENGKDKTDTKTIPWADRMKCKLPEGYRLIGVNCGCVKKIDEKTGNEVNDNKMLTPFDACREMTNLKDGQSVFIRGNISYSEYQGRHMINFEPSQVSLCKPIDFDAEDFKPNALFTQPIVIQKVKKSETTPGEAVVEAKIVNYSSIEDTELYTRNAKLAKTLNKLKPFTHVKVFGDIVVESNIEEIEEDDEWGDTTNKMDRVGSPFVRKLMITGGDKGSIDTEEYSEEKIDHALSVINASKRAKSDYGKKDDSDEDDWGSTKTNGMDEDDDMDFELDV